MSSRWHRVVAFWLAIAAFGVPPEVARGAQETPCRRVGVLSCLSTYFAQIGGEPFLSCPPENPVIRCLTIWDDQKFAAPVPECPGWFTLPVAGLPVRARYKLATGCAIDVATGAVSCLHTGPWQIATCIQVAEPGTLWNCTCSD